MTYLVPFLIAAATLVAAAAGATAVPRAASDAVAAVFPPWWGREQAAAAVAQADALIVREGAVGSILVVRATDAGLADRLRSHGALVLLDPIAAGGCLSGTS